MSSEAGHIQISEFSKDVVPSINWMMEDLFCQYGVSIPYFMLDYEFPDYSQRPDWVGGYNFNLDWGAWGYWLPWFNELLGLLWDEAHLPRLTLPDLSPGSWAFFNDYTEILYDNMQRHYVYGQSGTFTKDEVIEGETSGITGWYKWKDSDGYIHVANKQDASGESVADFEDEKIVGADSGTYAYTYEDYVYYVTYHDVKFSGCNISRLNSPPSTVGYEDAWDVYQNDPYWSTWGEAHAEAEMYLYTYGSPTVYYNVTAAKGFLKMNTVGATASPTSALFRLYLYDVIGDDQTLNIYVQDPGDDVDSEDWSGGVLAGNTTINESDKETWIEISLDTDHVNPGGYSWYKLSLAVTDANSFPGGPYRKTLDVSDAQLKLGYNE